MPELPDLQVFSSNLNRELRKKEVQSVRVVNKSKLKVSEATIKKSIEGAAIKKVQREGKELHFTFTNGTVLGLHLMLHGRLHLFEKENANKHTIIALYFEDGSGLALTDYQGAATPTLNPEKKDAPDALSAEVNEHFLKEKLSKKRTSIKNFLLDQKIIRGIGNAYADEILWKAGISPFSTCNRIPEAKIRTLAKTIPTVLSDAEKRIRKTDPDIISGEIRDFLKIHNAKREESPTGGKIRTAMLNSRITYYTDEQELYD